MRPGQLASEYAKRNGWTLRPHNLMVEGDSDVTYLQLASKLYYDSTELNLLGKDFGVFSAGQRDEGGTFGIFEQLPPLLKIISSDPDPRNGIKLYRVSALVDNDKAGRDLQRALLNQYRHLRANRDIFLLQRVLPRTNSDSDSLTRQIRAHNRDWAQLDCEIEDLLGDDLLSGFIQNEARDPVLSVSEVSGYRHYEWARYAKVRLRRYTEQNASLDDVTDLLELLKSLRYYFGLAPEGV